MITVHLNGLHPLIDMQCHSGKTLSLSLMGDDLNV